MPLQLCFAVSWQWPNLLFVAPLVQVINQVGAVSLQATLNCEEFASAHTATTFYDIKSFVGMAWRPAGEPICCGAAAASVISLRCTSQFRQSRLQTHVCVYVCARVSVCARAQKSTRLGRPSVSPLDPRRPRLHAMPTLAVRAPLDCLHRSLPGSTCERELYDSFARMLPELCALVPVLAALAPPLARCAHVRVARPHSALLVGGSPASPRANRASECASSQHRAHNTTGGTDECQCKGRRICVGVTVGWLA